MRGVHQSKPVVLWIIGALVESQLVVTYGSRLSQIQVTIDFLREHDRVHALRLYNAIASAPFKLENMNLLSVASPYSLDEGLSVCIHVYASFPL